MLTTYPSFLNHAVVRNTQVHPERGRMDVDPADWNLDSISSDNRTGLSIFPNPPKTLSVYRARSIRANGFTMGLGSVSFMTAESELGKLVIVPFHDPVPGHLGDDRRRSDGSTPSVAAANDLLGPA